MKNDSLPKDKRDHYLQIIETESDRLSKLSDNLLKLTALENERHPVNVATYRLDEQIRQILLFFEPQWKNKAIQMRIDLDKIAVTADGDLMNQVWTNLIQNSIKFTPEHGVVTVTLKKAGSQTVFFSITDTGIGIKKADQQHLFERFYKADRSSRNRALGGNGLGLSIVKKIVDMHNGKISVKSEYGKGTTITVKLDDRKRRA
ncbi:HAMP domain-containing sensor histidine kinase [Terrilactibacillus sp. S3-3]|nr:HAMP domain-containing sensor histidine kinase [Terrilactibacillus sp. S3-3]